MKVIILGAGTIGICTAWHLLERGHEVTVVERQSAAKTLGGSTCVSCLLKPYEKPSHSLADLLRFWDAAF
jgi:glycine/D-amino acid oxidase-like deaminating enzyme